jgi:hypothetical protein
MNEGRTIFAQLMDSLPRREFNQCVERYKGNHRVRAFSCLDQFLTMAFAQLTFRESLRDIETCLSALDSKLYHAGFRCKVARNTLAKANERRSWRIYADLAQVLIARARRLYCDESFGVELDQTVYALDSSTIDLCLALFPWAKFRKRKGAIKLHTLLDLRGNIPVAIIITTGKTHDVKILDRLIFEPGAFYIFDRAYVDFKRLRRIDLTGAFFVTLAKRNLDSHRVYSRWVDKSTGLRSDQSIALDGQRSREDYPDHLRRISFYDETKNKRLVFVTNNFELPALTIAQLYKCRWQVELFFKWIKQHLRIKAFYGTSQNAVKTQVWIAVSVYVLVAIMKKNLDLDASLYTILQILSLTLFEKMPILQAFSEFRNTIAQKYEYKQLDLFDF